MQLAYKYDKCRYVRFIIQLKKFTSASNYPDTRIILKLLRSKARIISFDNLVKRHTLQVQYNTDYSFIPAGICGSHYR
jgi:hypothetical protein